MKKIITFLFSLIILHTNCISQNKDNEILKFIRDEYNTINSCKLSCIEKDVSEQSTEGGFILICNDNNKMLRKAVVTNYGEIGKVKTEYYFKDRKIIFVYEIQYLYDAPIYEKNKSKVKNITENRYYFNNEKLFYWISVGNKVIDKKVYELKEKQIVEDIDFYKLK